MTLRSLTTTIVFRDQASSALTGLDSKIDDIRDNVGETGTEFSNLSSETTAFADAATTDIQDVSDEVDVLKEKTEETVDVTTDATDTGAVGWGVLAGAVAGATAALELFVRMNQDMFESAERTAYITGLLSEEVRELAVEMSDATFPLNEAYGLMHLAARQGIESEDALRNYALYWDMVGDASGESSLKLAESSIALRATGIAAGEEEQALAAFGYVITSTSQDIGTFLYNLERSHSELDELGFGINEAAALVGVFEEELGVSAITARSKFREAVREAEGDLGTFYETLGVSEEVFQEYVERVESSSTAIQDLADIHAASRTSAQRLQAEVTNLTHQYGAHFLPIIDMAIPALMGLTTVLGIAAAGKFLGAKAALTYGVAIAGATLPLWAIIGAVVAVGVALYLLWTRVDWFREGVLNVVDQVKAGWDFLTEGIMSAWSEQRGLIGGIARLYEFLKDVAIAASQLIGGAVNYLIEAWREGEGILGTTLRHITTNFMMAMEFIVGILKVAGALIWAIFTGDIEPLRAAWGELTGNISARWREMTDNIVDWISNIDLVDIGRNIIMGLAQGLWSGIQYIEEAVAGVRSSIVDGIKGFFGISSPSTLMEEYGINMAMGLQLGLETESKSLIADILQTGIRMPDTSHPATGVPIPSRDDAITSSGMAAGKPGTGGVSPVINIHIEGVGKDAEEIADAIDRRMRQTFSQWFDRYFGG